MIKNVLGRNMKNATVVIRADRDVPTGNRARGDPRVPGSGLREVRAARKVEAAMKIANNRRRGRKSWK